MAALRHDPRLRPGSEPSFLVLCAAIALALVRAKDQPSFDVAAAGTSVEVVPADVAVAVLATVCVARLLGSASLPRPARAPTVAAAAFSSWLLLSSATNGGDALVAAGKLLEYGVLALGVVLLVRRRVQLWLLVGLLVAFTTAAATWGLLGFLGAPLTGADFPGRRQPSFTGEHELAALGTMTLVVALAALYTPQHRLRRLPLLAGVAGGVAVVLGAALAGLIGLYLAVAALVASGVARGTATRRALAITAIAALAVTGGVLTLRSGDLGGFLRSLGIGEPHEDPTRNVAGWNERLVYVYVGGRIFLDNPVLGTGWHGTLPPEEYERYLPDARRRFPDTPAYLFPGREGFIPQQTYDQVLYELGIVGALLFVALGLVTARATVQVVRRWPRGDPDEPAAYLPAAWLGALAGGLTGAALFGGSALTAIFWLVLGVAALAPSLVPPEPFAASPSTPPAPRARNPLPSRR